MYLPNTIQGEKVYTRKQFASLLGVSSAALYKWEKKGTLIPKRTAKQKKIYYTQSQYEEIMNGEI